MLRLGPGRYFGTPRRTWQAGGISVRETRYAAGALVPPHAHERPYLCLVVAGSFVERSGGRLAECARGSVVWHPAGDTHADRFGQGGGACLNLEFDRGWHDHLASRGAAPAEWVAARGGGVAWLAERVRAEVGRPDSLFQLALEGLAASLMAELTRSAEPAGAARGTAPPWLARAVERLRAERLAPPPLGALAADAGVHPTYLARVFRRHVGVPPCEFVRRLRIEWACEAMGRPDAPSLGVLAQQAGFADQAHFTRTFKRVTGTTPAAFRDALATGRGGRREVRGRQGG